MHTRMLQFLLVLGGISSETAVDGCLRQVGHPSRVANLSHARCTIIYIYIGGWTMSLNTIEHSTSFYTLNLTNLTRRQRVIYENMGVVCSFCSLGVFVLGTRLHIGLVIQPVQSPEAHAPALQTDRDFAMKLLRDLQGGRECIHNMIQHCRLRTGELVCYQVLTSFCVFT